MATPHVAGFSAYLLGLDSSLTPSSIASTIKLKALSGVLSGIRKYCTPAFAQRNLTIISSLWHHQQPPQQRSPNVEALYQYTIYPIIYHALFWKNIV